MYTEKEAYLRTQEEAIRAYYRALASHYEDWMCRWPYYYQRKLELLQRLLPQPGRVLEIGCGLGQNLAGLNPEYGLGIDLCPEMVEAARRRYPAEQYPKLEFRCLSALDCGQLEGPFDTILLANSVTEIPDLAEVFRQIATLCSPETRIVQTSYNYLLAPAIRFAGRLGLVPRHPVQNWLTRADLDNLAALSGFEMIRDGFAITFPFNIPVLGPLANRYLPLLPLLRYGAVLYYSVLRPPRPPVPLESCSVSVCVPCKNEAANIPGLARRIPEIGAGTEIIFVDDQSTDDTAAAVLAAQREYPHRNIRLVKGPGQGKGAACRAGFAEATGDLLVILDADMAVMPEELPGVCAALVSGRAEFINGSRLVYPMEDQAMRSFNVLGNKLFAMLFSFLLSQPIKDTLCGTKALWRWDYPRILEARRHFGEVDCWGDYDWIFGAARHNLKIVEYPVHYRQRVFGETKMTKRLRNAGIMLRMCLIALRKLRAV